MIMEKRLVFTPEERTVLKDVVGRLRSTNGYVLTKDDEINVFRHIRHAIENNEIGRDIFGLNPVLQSLRTASIAISEIGLKRDGTIAVLLYPCVKDNDEASLTTMAGTLAKAWHEFLKDSCIYRNYTRRTRL